MTTIATSDPRFRYAAWLIAAVLLLLSLGLHLLPALLAGLLVYELVALIAPLLQRRFSSERAVLVAVAALALLMVALLTGALFALVVFLRSDAGSLSNLFTRLADIVEQARSSLPPWLVQSLPEGAEAMHDAVVGWLKSHAREVQVIGKEAAHALAHLLIGMVIGGMVAVGASRHATTHGPLAVALRERVVRLGDAFRRIVFAQVQISAINTVLTAIFLGLVMPLIGFSLPLLKTLVAVTFLAGLLPVIGNLISNLLIVLVALSVSLEAGLTALVFLVAVHKLEYFLNARIVGSQISAHAWELLLAMVLFESAFGIAGVVAAPIFYAYVKDELTAAGLI